LRRKKIMLEIESRFVPLLSTHLIKRDKDVFEQQQIQQRFKEIFCLYLFSLN